MRWLVRIILLFFIVTNLQLEEYYERVLKGKVYAVSVMLLDNVWWTKYFEPTDKIRSIFIYDFREEKN